MNDAKKTVKNALSVVLVVVLIVATVFGLDVPYSLEELGTEQEVVQSTVVTEENGDKDAPPTTDEVETDTPQDSATTEDVIEDAENSAEGEVATPTEPTNDATEGDVKNA